MRGADERSKEHDGGAPAFSLRSTRLRLRQFRVEDLEPFLAYHNDPEVVRYQSWEPFTRAEGLAFVREQATRPMFQQGQWTQVAIEFEGDAALIGDCALYVDAADARLAELGITIAPARQGRGFAREALTRLLDDRFSRRALHRVVANVDPRNTPSIALFEGLGFVREGHLRENEWIRGEWCDTLVFGCLAREWGADPRRAGARAR
ncbi:MAG: GNAT family N-acetyltransferase [Myxococcales bacterium]|nr:GNAT family N-acetyltransferase [Myxococcales bacterium]